MMPSVLEALTEHRFLTGLPHRTLNEIAGQARFCRFGAGERLFFEADPADRFHLLHSGSVAIDMYLPGRGPVVVETIGPGDALGWSWLWPPHRWHFGAVARTAVSAVVIDGVALRRLCDEDPVLGYELSRRLLGVVAERLLATRIRMLDLYEETPR